MLHCCWWQICHKNIFVQWSVVSYCWLWHVVKKSTEFIVAFPLQQWLCKRVIMLHYVHIAYLVSSQLSSSEMYSQCHCHIKFNLKAQFVWTGVSRHVNNGLAVVWCHLFVCYICVWLPSTTCIRITTFHRRSICLCSRLVQTIYHYISSFCS